MQNFDLFQKIRNFDVECLLVEMYPEMAIKAPAPLDETAISIESLDTQDTQMATESVSEPAAMEVEFPDSDMQRSAIPTSTDDPSASSITK